MVIGNDMSARHIKLKAGQSSIHGVCAWVSEHGYSIHVVNNPSLAQGRGFGFLRVCDGVATSRDRLQGRVAKGYQAGIDGGDGEPRLLNALISFLI